MATDIKEETKPVVQEVKKKAAGFVAGVHARLDRAKQNVRQKYQDLIDMLSSVTKEWASPDDKAGKNMTFKKMKYLFRY